jgi:hypothetical protein
VRAALPSSIGFVIYRHNRLPLFAIDTFRASKPPRYPFSAATPATDLPLELPSVLNALTTLYEQLKEQGTANGLKRAYINLSCILSSCLDQDILSVFADDEGNDFACLSTKGRAVRITARCGDQVISFDNEQLSTIQDESDNATLQEIVSRQFELFTGHPASTVGLGSFDPPQNRGFVAIGNP